MLIIGGGIIGLEMARCTRRSARGSMSFRDDGRLDASAPTATWLAVWRSSTRVAFDNVMR